jgi:very-short-patch-repair endonuclease
MQHTLQLASRADLLLGIWLAQRGVIVIPQKAVGRYNIDLAIDELFVAVEVNGSFHYFADHASAEIERRNYLLDRGWRLIDVALTATRHSTHKYLRPACADQIVILLNLLRTNESDWGQYRMIGGDGEALPGFQSEPNDGSAISRSIATLDS